MAFWGSEFVFDGISCADYGLMMYEFEADKQDDVVIKGGTPLEDRINGRYDAISYGVTQNEGLEFTLVFGAGESGLNTNTPLDRFDIEAVSAWLTGHQERKWLLIAQDDMEMVRYKCYINDLKIITYGSMPWAFSCRVLCDSPFAYTLPEEYSFDVSGEANVRLFSRSSYNGYYKPNMEITVYGGGDVSIQNLSDNNRTFQFSGLPAGSPLVIYVDNKNQVITNNMDLNLYPSFNMKFMRLIRGDNRLRITGQAKVKFICEFPVSIGG